MKIIRCNPYLDILRKMWSKEIQDKVRKVRDPGPRPTRTIVKPVLRAQYIKENCSNYNRYKTEIDSVMGKFRKHINSNIMTLTDNVSSEKVVLLDEIEIATKKLIDRLFIITGQ